jgi:hypothetical protein
MSGVLLCAAGVMAALFLVAVLLGRDGFDEGVTGHGTTISQPD